MSVVISPSSLQGEVCVVVVVKNKDKFDSGYTNESKTG